MPVVDGRLTCCTCGSDLGDAEDPYRDPGCLNCINREAQAELEAERDIDFWNDVPASTHCDGDLLPLIDLDDEDLETIIRAAATISNEVARRESREAASILERRRSA